jgi:hypothetical protein
VSADDDAVGPATSAYDLTDPGAKKPDGFEGVIDAPQRTNDPRALRRKQVSDKNKALQDENDLRAILSTPEGLRFVARIIGTMCGWNSPYFHPSNSVMCEIAGRRSIGFQLEQIISDADLELWLNVRRLLEQYRAKPQKDSKDRTGA